MVNFTFPVLAAVALAPLEALDAFLAGLNTASAEDHASCNQLERQESRGTDAVNCIDQLRGNPDNEVPMTASRQLYYAHGTAQIWGGAGPNLGGKTTFREIAETASRILDSCTRADGWVQGTDDTTNGIAIHISSEFNA
ncbi:hypothetical protein HYQ44_003703 [Verticillium longisporum]|nr:hypothetical protein HYQ44_003703 [Verticillium longisporum]